MRRWAQSLPPLEHPTGGVPTLRNIVLNKVCLTIFDKCHEYFFTLAKQQRWFPLHIWAQLNKSQRRVSDTFYFHTLTGAYDFFPSRDFSHIKHSVTLNKCIKTVSLFKEACLLRLHFSQLQRAPSLCSLPLKSSLEVPFLEWASDVSSSILHPMCQASSSALASGEFAKAGTSRWGCSHPLRFTTRYIDHSYPRHQAA